MVELNKNNYRIAQKASLNKYNYSEKHKKRKKAKTKTNRKPDKFRLKLHYLEVKQLKNKTNKISNRKLKHLKQLLETTELPKSYKRPS